MIVVEVDESLFKTGKTFYLIGPVYHPVIRLHTVRQTENGFGIEPIEQ